MVVRDHDVSRFADRSRELWSERAMSDAPVKDKDCSCCCETCPVSSLFAFILTLVGTTICCLCLYKSLPETIVRVNYVFDTEYIDADWIRIINISVIFVMAIMGGFSLILLIVGSLATDATRQQIYTGFRSRLGGRIATGFFSMIVYALLLIWLFTLITLVIPCMSLYILKYRCDEASRQTTNTSASTVNTPTITCLTPASYGIPAPKQKPDVKICQKELDGLCELTKSSWIYLTALAGSFLVVLGLIHFLCSLVANYAHIKDGRKLCDYEEAIREEFETSKLHRG